MILEANHISYTYRTQKTSLCCTKYPPDFKQADFIPS